MKIRQGVVLGAVVGVMAVGIGAVSAFGAVAIPGADGKIRVCVKYEDINHYEQMRWITGTTCAKHEKRITWNAEGVKGDKGDKGATGAPGAPGAPGAAGAPGTSEAYFTNSNNSYVAVNKPTTVHTLTVPEGRYAVTATTEVINHFDDGKGAACAINNFAGQTKRNVSVPGHDTDVLTVIGVITTEADGKINLICSSQPETDSTKVADFNESQIMATKIG